MSWFSHGFSGFSCGFGTGELWVFLRIRNPDTIIKFMSKILYWPELSLQLLALSGDPFCKCWQDGKQSMLFHEYRPSFDRCFERCGPAIFHAQWCCQAPRCLPTFEAIELQAAQEMAIVIDTLWIVWNIVILQYVRKLESENICPYEANAIGRNFGPAEVIL